MTGVLRHRHIVVMGVCACGKSTVGKALAARANIPFADGDSFHPDANIAKMEAGTPLTDADRWPWLTKIGEELGQSDGLDHRLFGAQTRLSRSDFREGRSPCRLSSISLEQKNFSPLA